MAGGPFLLAIDGRSSSGKSTLAAQVAAAVPGAGVVHTDDIAWHHAVLDWDHLVREHVIEPLRAGRAVDYRPPGWVARDRPGSVLVPASAPVVVIEGVGAGRASLAAHVDAVVWVETPLEIARARDEPRIAAGEIDPESYELWMAEELPFQEQQRTWERADVVVDGTQPGGIDAVLPLLPRA
jgi:uridine kinase